MHLNFKSGKILEFGGNNHPLTDQNGNRVTYNVDINSGENVDFIYDINKLPLPFENSSWDGIYSAYCIEHLSWRVVPEFLKECYRILRPTGKFILFVPNTLEQCKMIIEKGINEKTIETLFGSQEIGFGSHSTGFSPEYVKKLFNEAGFIVKTMPVPGVITDMMIEAFKIKNTEVFERSYFDGEIGYGGRGYRDFATHYSTARIIMQSGAKSVLDVGGARGYIVKILENEGVHAVCMDISKHCYMTRATDNFVLHDATKTPWSFKDKEFQLCFSLNFLEHIPEEKLDDVIRETIRVSEGGLHGIHFDKSPFPEEQDTDITHCTLKSEEWWTNKFKTIDPNYTAIIKHPRYLEYEKPEENPPISIMPIYDEKTNIKLNLGCFTNMFYYGWTNIDIIDLYDYAQQQKYFFRTLDVTRGLPYEDKSVDMIFSSHLLEHLDRIEGYSLLRECHRVLKPNGLIRLCTPDAKILTQDYLDGKIGEYRYINTGVENADDDAEAYYNLLLSGHKTIYDKDSLTQMLQRTGFKEILVTSPFHSRNNMMQKETIVSHPVISLVLEAVKN